LNNCLAAQDDVRSADDLGLARDFVACVLEALLKWPTSEGQIEEGEGGKYVRQRRTYSFDIFAFGRFARHSYYIDREELERVRVL